MSRIKSLGAAAFSPSVFGFDLAMVMRGGKLTASGDDAYAPVGLESSDRLWDTPNMTVIADSKKRVILKPAKPGDRFDVKVSPGGEIVLTRLVPEKRRDRVRLVKKHG